MMSEWGEREEKVQCMQVSKRMAGAEGGQLCQQETAALHRIEKRRRVVWGSVFSFLFPFPFRKREESC